EGFTSVEEVAYVELEEISMIEGFDNDTAEEIQARARDYLEELETRLDQERRDLGVSDDLRTIDGLTTAMLVALGKDDVKSVEDLAGCATDDLVGWTERKDGETKRFEGALSAFDVSRADAEAMIMSARVSAGWVTEEELNAQQEDGEAADDAEAVEEEAEEVTAGAILKG
ncbi:MAG: helix-hairpin-helix domain-containing protein, partial [Roseibium sp.]